METSFSIVLLRPEIPHKTGAIGRLCVGLGVPLHLVKPLGFALDDRYRESLFSIPMPGEHARSINLANAVSIAAYECFRQLSAGNAVRQPFAGPV